MLDIKVAIYEDNLALREGLTYLVKGSGILRFAGAFANALNILSNCENDMPDIILMDIEMPGISGIEATRIVKDKYPQINVMMLTVFENKENIFEALCAGATGYLLKKATAVQIIEAITELANGGSPMSGEIARKALEYFSQPGKVKNADYDLSNREKDILRCLVEGDSYKMIADHCFITIGTVRCHINSIYRKLAVNSKSEAVIKAIKEKIV